MAIEDILGLTPPPELDNYDVSGSGEELPDQPQFQTKQNFAETLDEDQLKKLGDTVYDDYKNDLTSRSGLDDRMKSWYSLYAGIPPKKAVDTLGSSNVSIPLITIACHQYHSRSFEALVPAKEIAKCVSRDDTTINASVRANTYMNYQLTEKMEEWSHDTSKAILSNALNGFVVKKTYYDPLKKRVVSLHLRGNEFAAPYDVVRLEDASRLTHIYPVTKNDIAINKENGTWINTDKLVRTTMPSVDEVATDLTDEINEATGVEESPNQEDRPFMILEQHRGLDLDKKGIEKPYIVTIDKETRAVLRIDSRLYNDSYSGEEKTFHHFTSYIMLPNANTWMGTGFGHLLEHLNQVANTLYNQLIDSGKLANLSGNTGFIQELAGIRSGDMQIKPGFFAAVKIPIQDLKNAILPLQFSEPSTTLHALLQDILEYAQRVSSVSDAMVGETPPSDTAATTTLNVMEQGLKVFSTSLKEMHASLKSEFRKIFILNSLYMDEEEYLTVQNSLGSEMEGFESGHKDFSNILDVIPVSDPNITSRTEKYAKARQAYELMLQDPDTANDKEAMYWLKHMILTSLGIQEIDKILKKPEPPPEPPDLRPEEEEAEFLKELNVKPLEGQDHEYHLASHETFKESMAEQPEESPISLSPQGRKLLEGHLRETMSLYYLELERSKADDGEGQQYPAGETGIGSVDTTAGYPPVQEEVGDSGLF